MSDMVYRSPWLRWVLAGVGLAAGVLLAFGDGHTWRSTPSLRWLALAPIPLQAWGIAFVVYAVTILFPRTQPKAFALGAVLYAVFTFSLFATIKLGNPINAVALAALLAVIAFHIHGIGVAFALRDARTVPR